MKPQPGETYLLTKAASVQFALPILFRIIRVHDWTTYDGWIWLDGYELNDHGDAVERRSVFVIVAGLIPCKPKDRAVPPRTRNTGPAPQQRRTGNKSASEATPKKAVNRHG